MKKTRQRKTPGKLFVLSAPSGAGKTTLCKLLLKRMLRLRLSVSYTTRQPRAREVNDRDYTFISERKFKGMIRRGEFAEWAVVHGNLYGTSLKRLRRLSREGYDIIFDVDTQGAMQLKRSCEGAVFIFILPPSLTVLKKRLAGRKTESREKMMVRLQRARDEISAYREYDYIVVNDDLRKAYSEIESILTATRLRTEYMDHAWVEKLKK